MSRFQKCQIGNTDLAIDALGFGCASLGNLYRRQKDFDNALSLLQAASDAKGTKSRLEELSEAEKTQLIGQMEFFSKLVSEAATPEISESPEELQALRQSLETGIESHGKYFATGSFVAL